MPKRNPRVMRGRRLLITVTIDPDQVLRLDQLADLKRTSRAALVREAIDLLLARYINGTHNTIMHDPELAHAR